MMNKGITKDSMTLHISSIQKALGSDKGLDEFNKAYLQVAPAFNKLSNQGIDVLIKGNPKATKKYAEPTLVATIIKGGKRIASIRESIRRNPLDFLIETLTQAIGTLTSRKN